MPRNNFNQQTNACIRRRVRRKITCQITCLICSKAIATTEDGDFDCLADIDAPSDRVLKRNRAALTDKWPRHVVHRECCRRVGVKPRRIAELPPARSKVPGAAGVRSKAAGARVDRAAPRKMEPEKAAADWSAIMGRMQPAPTKAPKKRAAPAKPPASAAKKPCVEPAKPKKYAFEPPPSFAEHQEFDIERHGYLRVGGRVLYRTPDGALHDCTGVDAFGPFKLAPTRKFN